MERQHVDITQDLEGAPVVHAIFDLREEEIAADDVVEFRELTALSDELRELVGGAGTIVMRPARLNAYRSALGTFVESRDEAEWLRDEDREPLAIVRGLLWPLDDLAAEAMQAALSQPASRHA